MVLIFNSIDTMGDKVGNKVGDKVGDKPLNIFQIKVLAEIRNNSNITKPELMLKWKLMEPLEMEEPDELFWR